MSLILALCLLFTFAPGAVVVAEDDVPTISIAIMNGPKIPDTWSQKQLEERLGVKFDLIFLPGWSDAQAKINLLMNDPGQMPDVIWWWGMQKEYRQWADAGLLVDLLPLLKENESKNILDYYGKYTMFGSYHDGHIYRIPGDVAEPNCMTTIIRKDWLDALGMDVPTTLDEYVEFIKRCTAENPGNVEYPYGFAGTSGTDGVEWRSWAPFFYPFGVNPAQFMLMEDGTVKHGSTLEGNKEALAILADLYAEGCIEPSIFTRNDTDELFVQGNFGTVYRWIAYFSPASQPTISLKQQYPEAELLAINPIQGPDGFSSDEAEELWGWCYYGITQACEDPAMVLKVMDQIADGSNYILNKWGEEGTHYELREDGAAEFLVDEDVRNADGLSTFTGFVNRKDEYNLENTEELKEMFANGAEKAQPMIDKVVRFKQTLPLWDGEYSSDLNKLRDEYFYSIITGERPVEDFDEYVELFYELGGTLVEEEANEYYQAQNAEYLEFDAIWEDLLGN